MKDSRATSQGRDQQRRYAPFETLRYDPAAIGPATEAPGFVRLDRHLRRLERSSAWLGVGFDRAAVCGSLREAVAGLSGPQRVRFTLTTDGRPEVSVTPLALPGFHDTPAAALAAADALLTSGLPLPRGAVARQRVDEADPARGHKTTARELYYRAREVAQELGLDDVLFLDSRGRLAEGSISSVFVVGGEPDGWEVYTPPLSTGALPGVLREELLELGLVEERSLVVADLWSASAVLLGSSVRGLRRVELQREPVDVA